MSKKYTYQDFIAALSLNASVLALPIAQAIEGQLTDQKEK